MSALNKQTPSSWCCQTLKQWRSRFYSFAACNNHFMLAFVMEKVIPRFTGVCVIDFEGSDWFPIPGHSMLDCFCLISTCFDSE